jgi:hypothetical protein
MLKKVVRIIVSFPFYFVVLPMVAVLWSYDYELVRDSDKIMWWFGFSATVVWIMFLISCLSKIVA